MNGRYSQRWILRDNSLFRVLHPFLVNLGPGRTLTILDADSNPSPCTPAVGFLCATFISRQYRPVTPLDAASNLSRRDGGDGGTATEPRPTSAATSADACNGQKEQHPRG